jgi:hypothetical protein
LETTNQLLHTAFSEQRDALAYYCVCEMIAAQILGFYWFDGKEYHAKIVSNHWGYKQNCHLLQPILFCSGKNSDLLAEKDETV